MYRQNFYIISTTGSSDVKAAVAENPFTRLQADMVLVSDDAEIDHEKLAIRQRTSILIVMQNRPRWCINSWTAMPKTNCLPFVALSKMRSNLWTMCQSQLSHCLPKTSTIWSPALFWNSRPCYLMQSLFRSWCRHNSFNCCGTP